ITAVIAALLVPLYVNYDLPLRAYIGTTARWMAGNLAHVALLIAVAAVIAVAAALVPGTIPLLSVAVRITASTALCLPFFAATGPTVRWMVGTIAHVALLTAAAAVIAVAAALVPGTIPFLSVGVWITASTALCLAFFAANERRLEQREPLRIPYRTTPAPITPN